MGRGEEGFKPVYESEVRRLTKLLAEIEADIESFKALLPRKSKMPKQAMPDS